MYLYLFPKPMKFNSHSVLTAKQASSDPHSNFFQQTPLRECGLRWASEYPLFDGERRSMHRAGQCLQGKYTQFNWVSQAYTLIDYNVDTDIYNSSKALLNYCRL